MAHATENGTSSFLEGPEEAAVTANRPSAPPREQPFNPASRAATKRAKIMIVDDEPINVEVVRECLAGVGYSRFVTLSDPREVLPHITEDEPDVILLDIMMPHINGLEILRLLRNDPQKAYIPVLILTAAEEEQLNALELGATDVLGKPVSATSLIARVRNALVIKAHHDHLVGYAEELESEVHKRTTKLRRQTARLRRRSAELDVSRLELIHCLARAAEFRDNETGRHVVRVGKYAGIIARELGLAPELAQLIEHAAPLHDVGKIGVPDDILLKPGKLDPDEYEFIQRHGNFGKRILEPMPDSEWRVFRSHTETGASIMNHSNSPIIRTASRIAVTHHERWDGTGYPLGLAGEDIPIEGRITAVADVFDALSSKRPYKPAFPIDKCFAIMLDARGKHFDPEVLDAFLNCKDEVVRVQIEYADID
jgi:putative two-component system response regulator